MGWGERLAEVAGEAWRPVSLAALAGYSLAALLVLWAAHSGERWVPLLDNANLAFHEAGHPIFGLLLGERFAVYGGTLGQLAFPLAAAGAFWARREAASLALALLWLGENLFNIARYMADARARILPLVGGGDHDWAEIFTRWGVLEADVTVAGLTRFLGWGLILAAWGWLAWRWRADAE